MTRWAWLALATFAVFVSAAGKSQASPAQTAPVLPRFDAALERQFDSDVRRADRFGMGARVFAKVGDSNTAALKAFYGLGCRRARLDGRRSLAAVIARYRAVTLPTDTTVVGAPTQEECPAVNSFSRQSLATRSASSSELFSTPVQGVRDDAAWNSWFYPDERCRPAETMIACEIRAIRPRYTLIAVGTNDLAYGLDLGDAARERIRLLVSDARWFGSVPVLLTPPPLVDLEGSPRGAGWNYVRDMAGEIVRVGRQMRVPVLNVWRALRSEDMDNFGLRWDGIHIQTYGDTAAPGALTRSVDFRPAALRYGNNRRNLLLLQLLARLDAHAPTR